MDNIIPYILFAVAAILNAFMDTSVDHFGESVFNRLNPNFWAMQISWKYCRTILGYHIDAWHIAKSLMVGCIIAAIISYKHINKIHDISDLLIFIGIWNAFFNLFYGYLFVRK